MECLDKIDVFSTFDKVYQKYREPFIKLAISYVGDRSIAEDFVTDSFVAYWENRGKLPAALLSTPIPLVYTGKTWRSFSLLYWL